MFISIVLVKLFGLASLPRVVTAQDQLAHNPNMFTNRLLRGCVGEIKCSISSWGSGSRKLSICWRRTIKGEVKSRVLVPLAEKVPLVPLYNIKYKVLLLFEGMAQSGPLVFHSSPHQIPQSLLCFPLSPLTLFRAEAIYSIAFLIVFHLSDTGCHDFCH